MNGAFSPFTIMNLKVCIEMPLRVGKSSETGIDVVITGVIQVDGNDADVGTNAGGGSGGTIDILTPLLFGDGEIRSNGGKGAGLGGGGSGGRIRIYLSEK